MTTAEMIAYHNDPKIKARYLRRVRENESPADKFALSLLAAGLISANCASGEVYGIRWRPQIARGCKNAAGYVVFTAHAFGTRMQLKAHRVVWLASGLNVPSGVVLDHINGNKSDNRLVNLRLATPRLNAFNRRSYSGASNPSAKLTSALALKIRERHKQLSSYEAVRREFGVSKSLVAQIVRGELWS